VRRIGLSHPTSSWITVSTKGKTLEIARHGSLQDFIDSMNQVSLLETQAILAAKDVEFYLLSLMKIFDFQSSNSKCKKKAGGFSCSIKLSKIPNSIFSVDYKGQLKLTGMGK